MTSSRPDVPPSSWRPLARRLADQWRSGGAVRFDRILATCSTWPIPTDWIEQLAEDGVLLRNVLNSPDGGLVRLTKTTAGCASGHFLPYPAYFMSMRGSRAEQPPLDQLGPRNFAV